MNPELLQKLVEAIVTILCLLITAYVVPWLKQKIGDDKYNKFVDFVDKCVRAADQYYESDQWVEKKAYVVGIAQGYAEKLAIGLDENEIDAIIEGLVNALREVTDNA